MFYWLRIVKPFAFSLDIVQNCLGCPFRVRVFQFLPGFFLNFGKYVFLLHADVSLGAKVVNYSQNSK